MISPSIKIGGRPRELLEGDMVVRNIREEQEEHLRLSKGQGAFKKEESVR
jgi:hypothetical protein